MTFRAFSSKNRPVHLGRYPLERLARGPMPDLSRVPPFALSGQAPDRSILPAIGEYQAMMDAIRDGFVAKVRSDVPDDPTERAEHLKAFGYFSDATLMGIGPLDHRMRLDQPLRNPGIDRLAEDLRTKQTKTLASGIDLIMADLKDAMDAPPGGIEAHDKVLVVICATPRELRMNEPGYDWLAGTGPHVAALRATEIAVTLANYIRLLGWDARAHTVTSTDIDLNRAAVAAGLAYLGPEGVTAPFLGAEFGVAAITTPFEMTEDAPLGAGLSLARRRDDPFRSRPFHMGPHAFETLKRVKAPTTYIDEPNVARVPKRTDMFARAQFGDMGKTLQENATGGYYARKAAPSSAQRRLLGAFTLLQDGASDHDGDRPSDAEKNALAVKAASYFLGVDAVGISRCPEWTWYSHDATGDPITPPHDQAISMVIDQGYETMDGASGDDWISVAQSMRAYLRFSLLGGVIAKHIRSLGYKAKAHTVIDGEVLQPPLLLLAGLGEVSRIGEVILNPFLGPRLKSGVVTTDMPMAHDDPIDFGLQKFCEGCNKCARECPSGAITAGPKLMFNGYEIWKSDSQKCATYRITTAGGAMCGRCMKTCPWNLEGIFSEKPFRWAAMNLPASAPLLQRMDDAMGRGGLNPVKKWWWDLKLADDGAYRTVADPVNERDLQTDLDLKYEDQTLAVYPAPLAPHPYPYPFPMDREAGIEAYQAMVTAEEYQRRQAEGDGGVIHRYTADGGSPVLRVEVSLVDKMTDDVTKFEFRSLDGSDLPEWEAGAHLDIVIAPEYLRQYSMSGDPSDRSTYQIGVLREDEGRGGSKFLHRIFVPGRKIFISRPINHFPLEESASRTFLMGGGIGVTPMIAMAHRLHGTGADFHLHYSVPSRAKAGYLVDLDRVPWRDKVTLHVSDEGTRIDLVSVLPEYQGGDHVYACGPDRYMTSVLEAAEAKGFPDEARHSEYFSVPEVPDYENHPFRIRLAKSGRTLDVPEDQTAADVLLAAGIPVDIKCSDGICGVCKCGLVSGDVEHRDFVLSKKQRETTIITCQSRAANPDGEIVLDL